MRRREFIALLGSGVAAWPLAARAQQPEKLPTIGFLGTDASVWSPWTAAFVQRLRELGWTEGRNIAIEYRWSEGRPARHAEIAAEFVRMKVDVIVTNAFAASTVKQATSVIPIVFPLGIDPVGGDLIASLARPGGNVTGLTTQQSDTAGKRLELLREFSPGSAGWQQWETLAFPNLCWRWVRFRPWLARLASKLRHSKSGEQRILLPPSRRSRHNRTHFTLRAMHSFTPTVLASSRFRLARDCRQSSVSANLSKPERSCPTAQTSRISSGAPPNWSTKFCPGRSRATSRSSSRLSSISSSTSPPPRRLD